jgi:signal peptidase II
MWFYVGIIGLAIVLDQLSKWLVVVYLKPRGTFALIENVFHFTYAENTGAAFSFLQGRQSFLVIVTSIAMTVMLVYLLKWSMEPGEVLAKVAFALILGGGVGNLIDRVRLNYVVDFLDARIINFAIFNLADSFIVVGVGLYILSIFLEKSK